MSKPLAPSQEVAALRSILAGEDTPRPSLKLPGPIAVVTLWLPGAVSRRESWAAIEAAVAQLPIAARRPVPDDMGLPPREVATVLAPGCEDIESLRAGLRGAWETGGGILAVYDVAADRDGVPDSYSLIRDAFDTFPLARRMLETPVLSLDELLPFQPFASLTRAQASRLVRPRWGAVLASENAEDWMLPTLRHILSASSWTQEGAAAALGISVSGLLKRLRKLTALTGVEFTPADGPAVPFEFRLALHVYDLFAFALPNPGDATWAP